MTKKSFQKARSLPIYFRLISIFLIVCLILSDGFAYGSQTLDHRPQATDLRKKTQDLKPDFDIPVQYGAIEEVHADDPFSATRDPIPNTQSPLPSPRSSKTIIYIQDAHDSLEAQENIAQMIAHLVGRQGIRTVYEEGYEGPVPTDDYFRVVADPKLRQKVAYFYMDKLRLGGAEFAHINRRKDFKLIGADRIRLHLENIRQYRRCAVHRKAAREDLDAILAEMRRMAERFFPGAMKRWLHLRERFDRNQMDLLDYVRRLTDLYSKSIVHSQQTLEVTEAQAKAEGRRVEVEGGRLKGSGNVEVPTPITDDPLSAVFPSVS